MTVDGRRILILVDPMGPDGDRLRHCYWPDVLAQCAVSDSEMLEFSVDESEQAGTVLDISGMSHVIISWDTSNGDNVYKSDQTLDYFRSQGAVRCAELLAKGGVIFSECQTIKGLPVQAAYDAIFGERQIAVLKDSVHESERRGNTAAVCKPYAAHPLLVGLPNRISERYESSGERMFFAKYSGPEQWQLPIQRRFSSSLWFGWFTWWEKGWVPLLNAELAPSYKRGSKNRRGENAVLLAKVDRGGALIASTMWVAGAQCLQLIENLISLDVARVKSYQDHIGYSRILQDTGAGLALAIVLFGLSSLLVLLFRDLKEGWTIWFVSAAGVGFIPLVVGAWRWFYRRVWSRPFGVTIWRSTMRRPAR